MNKNKASLLDALMTLFIIFSNISFIVFSVYEICIGNYGLATASVALLTLTIVMTIGSMLNSINTNLIELNKMVKKDSTYKYGS